MLARHAGEGVRLCLVLDQAPELAALPWEYLHDGQGFLALSHRTPIVRYLPLPTPQLLMRVPPPLAVLAVLVNLDDGSAPLDVAGEWAQMTPAAPPAPAHPHRASLHRRCGVLRCWRR